DERGKHVSMAGFQSPDRYELEADYFASALLMPTRLFVAASALAREGLQAIDELSAKCVTSLESTAIRYVQTCRDPVAVIRSESGTIDYAFMSDSLKEFPGLD
ncbi:MAG: ImmA/IrrE family metallo-endopeptidase, partial [Gammaproteobacteria bacterium]|nr:ImmA/IrrE family metallo-endopeptidase [Gammaproteobacteria bacterium]